MQNVCLIASWGLIGDYKRQVRREREREEGSGGVNQLTSDLWLQGGEEGE